MWFGLRSNLVLVTTQYLEVMITIYSCGKQLYKRICVSVCMSACPSVPALVSPFHLSLFYQLLIYTYRLWLPNFQSHMWNLKDTQPKILVKRLEFEVSGNFLKNVLEIKYANVSWLPSGLIRFWSRYVDFLILAAFWLSETSQNQGFWPFSGENMGPTAWNLACWYILTILKTD